MYANDIVLCWQQVLFGKIMSQIRVFIPETHMTVGGSAPPVVGTHWKYGGWGGGAGMGSHSILV